MLGGHLPELMLVLTLALIVFGPKRLPEIGASLGKGIRDFRQCVSQAEVEAEQGISNTAGLPPIAVAVPEHNRE